jgi:hypothetical protein
MVPQEDLHVVALLFAENCGDRTYLVACCIPKVSTLFEIYFDAADDFHQFF